MTRFLLDPAPDGFPPLLILHRGAIAPERVEGMRRALDEVLRRHAPVVLEGDFAVAQLVDGRWQTLFPFEEPEGLCSSSNPQA